MLTLLFITLALIPTSSLTLQLPVYEVSTLEDSELNVLDFIRLSYQPLLFPEALSTNTLTALTPWTFPALPTSLEAATTFCIASTGSLSHHDNDAAEETIERRSKEKGDDESRMAERKQEEITENGETEETVMNGKERGKENGGEENVNAEKETKEESKGSVEARKESEGITIVGQEGNTECEGMEGCKKMGKESAEIMEETEQKEAVSVGEKGEGVMAEKRKEKGSEETRKEAERGKEGKGEETERKKTVKETEIPMSLRRFGMEGPGKGWSTAFTSITKELGTAVTLPGMLRDADLAFLDITTTGLRHIRAGWNGQGGGESTSGRSPAGIGCVVEGGLTLALTPLPPSIAALQCAAGQCRVTMEAHQEQAAPPDLSFLVQATTRPRACLYAPPGWQWAASALEDSTFLVFTWEDDLVIKEDVAEQLFKDVDEDGIKRTQRTRRREEATEVPTLWEALPKGASAPALLLWGDQNPLLHLLRRYLLSDRHFRRETFLQEFQVDRQLMPDLVDCSRECQASAIAIFKLLDANADGELTAADATFLTHDSFTSLSHQLDDLVDELNDLAREQWEEAVEGPVEARSAFLLRAKERLSASAMASVRRWVAGDLDETEEEALKEHLPSLYDQVLAARTTTAPRDNTEL